MKVYLAGENGKKKIIQLYESISCKRSIEDIKPTLLDRQTDRQTERMNVYLAGGLTGNLSPLYQSIASKQASKQASA